MIQQQHFKPYQEITVEFINRSMTSSFSSEFMFHQLTAITNHTIIVPQVRCHILILLLMMLSSSPASEHNFLDQVPGTKGGSPHHFYTYKQITNTTSNYCNFLSTLPSCFLVLWKPLLVHFCVVVWVLFQCLVLYHYFGDCTYPQHQQRSKVLGPFQ